MSDIARNPVRIEVATSEIDGGACRAWADPALVVAAVARSSPEDTFTRFVLPKLEGLSAEPEEGAPIGEELPPALRNLLLRIRSVHARLFRDNHSLTRDARWVELTCVAAEEDRIYLVRTAPSWVCILRAGQPLLADPGANDGSVGALGAAESLRLEVSSLSVEPDDVVVVLCAASESRPDLLSVQRLFSQTHDLKRACDGLVNLIGIQSPGASAVALRFVPVENTRERGEGANAVAGLVDAAGLTSEGAERPNPESEVPTFASSPGLPLDDWSWIGRSSLIDDEMDESDTSLPVADGSNAVGAVAGEPPSGRSLEPSGPSYDPGFGEGAPRDASSFATRAASDAIPASSSGGATPNAPEWQFPWEMEMASRVRPDRTPAPDALQAPVAAELPREDPIHEPTASSISKSWKVPVLLGALALLLGSLAAIPLRGGALFGAGKADLWIEPNPAGQRVFLDGQQVAEHTPCQIPAIKAGLHTLEIDYGPSGRWQGRVQVSGGKPFRWSESIRGSIEVSARDASISGSAWVQGGQKTVLPATLEALPLGWTRLFYEDERIPLWDRQVLVRADGAVSISIPNHHAGEDAFIAVEVMRPQEGEGLVASRGDSIYVDDGFTGLSPLEMATTPGLHSVRVASRGETRTQMCELRPGGSRQLVIAFDGRELPSFRHQPPGNIIIHGPVALSVLIQNPGGGTLSRPALHLPDLEPAWREVPLQAIDGGPTHVALLQPGVLPRGERIRYYFTVMGPGGDAVYSDLYRMLVEGAPPRVAEASPTEGEEGLLGIPEEPIPTTP